MIATASLPGLDTDITVSVTEPAALAPTTLAAVVREVARHAENIDLTVNRRRASAEIHAVDLAAGAPTMVSVLFEQILTDALFFADLTDGATMAVRRSSIPDYQYLPHLEFTTNGPRPITVRTLSPVPAHHRPRLGAGRVEAPADIRLELLTAARPFLAEYAAAHVAERFDCGVMVAVGRSVATAGAAPRGGWRVHTDEAIELPHGRALATVTDTDVDALPRSPFDARPASDLAVATVLADTAGVAQAAAVLMHVDRARARSWILEENMSAWTVDHHGITTEIGRVPTRMHAHAA